jgi:hypothetical protein
MKIFVIATFFRDYRRVAAHVRTIHVVARPQLHMARVLLV